MNRVTLNWADGVYEFTLPWGHIVELQDKTGVGPYTLMARLMAQEWRVQDLRETIRLGLIGGGLPPSQALTLVQRYVEARPLLESVPIAQAIIMSALVAPEGVSSPKDQAPEVIEAPETGALTQPAPTERVQ